MIFYCPKCFVKIEYKFKKPDFCQKCGYKASFSISESNTIEKNKNNLNSAKSSEISMYNSKRAVAQKEYIDEDYFEVDDVPFISPGKGVSFEVSPVDKKISLGEVISSSALNNENKKNDFLNQNTKNLNEETDVLSPKIESGLKKSRKTK